MKGVNSSESLSELLSKETELEELANPENEESEVEENGEEQA